MSPDRDLRTAKKSGTLASANMPFALHQRGNFISIRNKYIVDYINYSNIAAKILRRSLKKDLQADALKRDASHVRLTPWANGRPAHLQDAAAK